MLLRGGMSALVWGKSPHPVGLLQTGQSQVACKRQSQQNLAGTDRSGASEEKWHQAVTLVLRNWTATPAFAMCASSTCHARAPLRGVPSENSNWPQWSRDENCMVPWSSHALQLRPAEASARLIKTCRNVKHCQTIKRALLQLAVACCSCYRK